MSKVTFLGGGSFGISLAILLANKGNVVAVYDRDNTVVEDININRRNDKFIKGLDVPKNVTAYNTLEEAIVDSEFINYIKVNEEAYINSYITQLFNKYKEKGLDIFNVYRMKEIHYGKEEINDPLSICDLEINTKVNINGTGLSQNAL